MADYDYDLFVIGAGSGGVRAARMSAGFGARVAVAEDTHMGGTCVNVGCVPKKLFVYASEYADELEGAAGFGWQIPSATFHWPTLRDNKTREIQRLNGIYGRLLDNAGAEVIHGRAEIVSPHEVKVNDRIYRTARILIAVGGKPTRPDIPGSELMITSDDVFSLASLPQRILVLGGGYIAVEFAGIFQGLGVDTELVYRGPMFLRGFDQEVREFTAEQVRAKGIKVSFDCNISRIEQLSNGVLQVTMIDGSQRQVDAVMAATGRSPRLEGLGLEHTRVQLAPNGKIEVNELFQTHEPSVYAIGDVTAGPELTPVALAEGTLLANHLFNHKQARADYTNIPTAVFCQPNIGTVGLTEEQALAAGNTLRIYTSSFKPMKHTLSGIEERSFMKLVVDDSTDKVLGCHMVGKDAGEIIQGLAVALKMGATKADLDATIGIHPTAAEEFVTMREVKRTVSPQ